MRVFVAGATGAIGSRLVAPLASAGHIVIGLTRNPAGSDAIRRGQGEPLIADALNRAAIVMAVANTKPDAIIHEMTSLSAANDLRRMSRLFGSRVLRASGGPGLRGFIDHPLGHSPSFRSRLRP